MAQQAPEFKLVLVGDGGVGKCRTRLETHTGYDLIIGFSSSRQNHVRQTTFDW